MTTILQARENIKDAVETGVSSFKHVAVHGGRFTSDEIRRYAVKAPAALVACLGIDNIVDTMVDLVATMRWGIYVVTRGDSSTRRDSEALTLIQALAVLVKGNDFDESALVRPENLRAENIYSGGIDNKGIALWALTWTQDQSISDFDLSELDDFDTYHAQWDLDLDDDVIDAEDHLTGLAT